jgi:hypothetical protein
MSPGSATGHAIGIFVVLLFANPVSSGQAAEVEACLGRSFTPAEGVTVLCSANWHFTGGKCDEHDLVYDWKITGTTTPPAWNIPPWEERPITIRGVELTMVAGGEQVVPRLPSFRTWLRGWLSGSDDTHGNKTIWWMAGNNYVPDVMLFLGPDERHGRHMFPAKFGMPFPARDAKNVYLDLHGSCSGGGSVSFFYTVYYSIP